MMFEKQQIRWVPYEKLDVEVFAAESFERRAGPRRLPDCSQALQQALKRALEHLLAPTRYARFQTRKITVEGKILNSCSSVSDHGPAGWQSLAPASTASSLAATLTMTHWLRHASCHRAGPAWRLTGSLNLSGHGVQDHLHIFRPFASRLTDQMQHMKDKLLEMADAPRAGINMPGMAAAYHQTKGKSKDMPSNAIKHFWAPW